MSDERAFELLDAAQTQYRNLLARPSYIRVGTEMLAAVRVSYDKARILPGDGQPYLFKGLPVALDKDLAPGEVRFV